jgi:hypothetical protein
LSQPALGLFAAVAKGTPQLLGNDMDENNNLRWVPEQFQEKCVAVSVRNCVEMKGQSGSAFP